MYEIYTYSVCTIIELKLLILSYFNAAHGLISYYNTDVWSFDLFPPADSDIILKKCFFGGVEGHWSMLCGTESLLGLKQTNTLI